MFGCYFARVVVQMVRPAFFGLTVSAILAIAVVHLGIGMWPRLNAVLFAIWLGQLTNYGAHLYFYRREA